MKKVRFRKFSRFLMETFGRKVHKVGLWGGFSCPNRDGTLGVDGCSFCNPDSSRPASLRQGMSVEQQLRAGCSYVAGRYGVTAFLPYFQDYTATYGDPSRLLDLFSGVLSYPGVVGISLCTRPDCLGGSVLDMLETLAAKTFLWVEVGIQTFDDRILTNMNRCHSSKDSITALEDLRSRGIRSAAHMILGYPGCTADTAARDARLLGECGTDGVKLQNFHVVRGTAMEKRFEEGAFTALELDDYAWMAVRFLENTHPDTVVLRTSGQAPARLTVAPLWSLDRNGISAAISRLLESRDTWQGRELGFPRECLDSPAPACGSSEGP